MIYGDKLRQCLKTEQNPINKMYLVDLLINWEKVEETMAGETESPITTFSTALSTYTRYLNIPKFKYNTNKKCGFIEDHDVFKAYYLHDVVELLLKEAGVSEEHKGVKIKARPFCTGFTLQHNSYDILTQKPYLELTYTNNRPLSVGLDFDFNYRLVDKKLYNKTKIFIPLIIFYIEKHYNEKHFDEIYQLKRDMVLINPNTLLICLTESVDKKLIRHYTAIKEHLYVLRCNFKNDPYNDLQPQVLLALYNKLSSFANKELATYEPIVPFGNIDLMNKGK